MIKKFKILGKWDDDLLWCPSQCYLSIEYNNKKYFIYLRWRYDDPWECHLMDENQKFIKKNKNKFWFDLFEEYSTEGNYIYYRDSELKNAKKKAIELAKRWLKENQNIIN